MLAGFKASIIDFMKNQGKIRKNSILSLKIDDISVEEQYFNDSVARAVTRLKPLSDHIVSSIYRHVSEFIGDILIEILAKYQCKVEEISLL